MKKILIVTDAWHPQVNGVVRVQDEYIQRLHKRGYQVIIVEPTQFYTVPTPFYPEISLALFPKRKVRSIVRAVEPNHIHIMTEGPLGFAARSVCRSQKLQFTTWYHTHLQLYIDMRLRGLLIPVTWLLRRFHSIAARTFVSTETLKRTLEAEGFANVVVVPLGVDTDFFVRNPTPPIDSLPPPVFLYMSRLAPEKSPEEFLKLALPGTKLVVGDGPSRKRLESIYGDNARFIGYQRGKQLVDWMSIANVLVFPSRTETFGLVALEALSCGIPVAAHDVMGPSDIVTNGVDGYLSDNLKEAAMSCLNLSGDACRSTALKYSWENSVDKFVDQLASLENVNVD